MVHRGTVVFLGGVHIILAVTVGESLMTNGTFIITNIWKHGIGGDDGYITNGEVPWIRKQEDEDYGF
jgi:hypothetical protein